jgi:hypothetical protein
VTREQQKELLRALDELHDALPDMRFGQLVSNLATLARGPEPESVWDVEDEELLAAAREQLRSLRARASV